MTFYQAMKYACTGIRSPGMTHYDCIKALAMVKPKRKDGKHESEIQSEIHAEGHRSAPE